MTGKKTNKQRFIISSRLLVPSAVRKDMSEKASPDELKSWEKKNGWRVVAYTDVLIF